MRAKPDEAGALFTRKALIRLILPLIVEQFLAVAVGMADSMMVSVAGEAAVSGVSLVDMLNVLLINLMSALATGGAVVTAQMLGAKDKEGARESVRQLLIVSLTLSVLLMTVVLFCQRPMLRLVFGRIDDDVMQSALTYFSISAISYPFIAVYNACAALFRSMGDSRTSMIIAVGMNILNIGGNAVLIYGFHMGVAGVALPSLISRALAAVALLILLANPSREIFLDWRAKWRIQWRLIRKILHIGVPNGLENSLFQMGRILVLSIITTFGTVQITANAVANNLCALGCIPGQAIGLAMITVVGQCVGAGDYRQARRYTKKLLGVTYLVAGVLNAVILLSLPLLLRLYNISSATSELASLLIFIHAGAGILLWPASFTLPNALRAASDVRYTMVVSIASMALFRIVLSYILAFGLHMGAVGVWCAMIVDWACRVIAFVLRFHGHAWERKAGFQPPEAKDPEPCPAQL